MRVKTWRILDRGAVPADAHTIPFTCTCGYEAHMPVMGRVIAVNGSEEDGDLGIFFDNDGPYAIPPVIQCRKCGRIRSIATPHVR